MSIHLHKSNSVFFQIPKTGGTWVYEALKNSRIDFSLYHKKGAHNTYTQENLTNKRSFAFVRKPMDFYRSYWCYKMEHGRDANWYLEEYCWSNDFEEFIYNIISKKYPYVTQFYRSYIGEPQVLNYVGRQENLEEDLIKILRILNEHFDEGLMRKTPKANVSKLKPTCSKYLVAGINLLDKEVLNKYYYGSEDIIIK